MFPQIRAVIPDSLSSLCWNTVTGVGTAERPQRPGGDVPLSAFDGLDQLIPNIWPALLAEERLQSALHISADPRLRGASSATKLETIGVFSCVPFQGAPLKPTF